MIWTFRSIRTFRRSIEALEIMSTCFQTRWLSTSHYNQKAESDNLELAQSASTAFSAERTCCVVKTMAYQDVMIFLAR